MQIADFTQVIFRGLYQLLADCGISLSDKRTRAQHRFNAEGIGLRPTSLWRAIAGWLRLETFATAGTTTRKPGLWEIITTTTWQKAPEIPGDEAAKLRGGPRTSQL